MNSSWVEKVFSWVNRVFQAFVREIGLWAAPLPSGYILGVGLSQHTLTVLPALTAAEAKTVSIAFAIGVVSVGSVISKVAIKVSPRWFWALGINIVAVLTAFAVIGIGGDGELAVLGVVAETFAILSYVAQAGLMKDIEASTKEQAEVDTETKLRLMEAQAKIDAEKREQQLRHQQKLASIEANKEAKIAKATVQPSVQATVHREQSDVQPSVQEDMYTRLRDDILSKLKDSDGLNISQIAENRGVSRNTVYKLLRNMSQEGEVHKNGNGWELTK